MNSIYIKSVTKKYNERVTALNNVSLTINPGEFVVVMGQSGSGKSTLLQAAGLLDTVTSGDIIINGNSVASLNKKQLAEIRMKTIGFVFQAFHLNPNLKAYENVMLPMLINKDYKSKSDMIKESKKLIASVGLEERQDHYPGELSGGEQQRVAIARALANNPDFILADEPTGNLDSKNEQSIFEQLKKLSEDGKGVLVVCHNDAVKEYADKIYIMKDGVLSEEINKEESPGEIK